MRRSRRMLKQARSALLKAFVFSGFINVLMMATPLFTLQVFETVVPLGSIETLVILTAITGVALAALAGLEVVRDLILARAGGWLDQEMGEFILENGLKAGQPGSELKQDVRALETLRGFVSSPAVMPLFDGPWVPIFLVALALLHPLIGVLGVVSVAALFVVALLQALLTERLQRESLEVRERSGQWWGLATSNATLVAALGLAEGVARRWRMSNSGQIAGNYSLLKRTSFVKALGRLVRLGAQVAIYALGAWLVIADQVSPGVLVASAILLARALAPMEQLVGAIKPAIAAWRAYQRLKAMPDSVRAVQITDGDASSAGQISVKDVTVYLPGRKVPALRGVALEIGPGDCVAFVGPNGSGKSTFAAVIAGAVVPSAGSADLDGLPIHRWQRAGGEPRVGFMADDPMLAEGTVHENIVRFSDRSLMTAARAGILAGVHHRLQELPNGYETEVGQGGRALSLSDRRAVALARAVASTPRILVLDEPEAGLDGAGMRDLVHALEKLKAEGVSLVIATQDPRLLSLVDKVVILAGGMIQTVTTPSEMPGRGRRNAASSVAAAPENVDAGSTCLPVAVAVGRRA